MSTQVNPPAPKLHVFHVDEANEFWIAESAEDVQRQRAEMFGEDVLDESDDVGQMDDGHVMPIVWDEDKPKEVESMTCAEWVAKKGRGLLVACEP